MSVTKTVNSVATEEVNYEFCETDVQANITSAQSATPDELVEIGNKIWKQIKASKVDQSNFSACVELLKKIQIEYHDFTISFPIVVRWAVQARQYSSAAFRKYLQKFAVKPIKTREEFLKNQAEYLILIFKEKANHPTTADINKYRSHIVAELIKEDEEFKQINKEVEEQMAAAAVVADKDRRRILVEHLLTERAEKNKTN